MSAYGHQMEQIYSAHSLSGGSELRRSSFVLESGFYITSFVATILVAALAAAGLLLVTLLVSLAMMLQSCQSNHSGIIELPNINDEYNYCKVYSLHAKLNNLEGHDFPSLCKDLAIRYMKGGQYARDLDSTESVMEDYFNSVRPSNDDLDVVLIDIDNIVSTNPHSSTLLQSSIDNCITEAKNLKHMFVLRLYMKLQASGWSIILLSREHGKHQNVTINHLLSAGFRGWSSLMMRDDADCSKGNEFFSKQRNVIQRKGFRIKSVISSEMDALIVGDRGIRVFLLPDPIFDKFEQQRRT